MDYKIAQEEQSSRIDNTEAKVVKTCFDGQAVTLPLEKESSFCFSKALTVLSFTGIFS